MDTPPPGQPTRHPPGSAGKVAAMAARAARGEPLFHPGDAEGEGRAPPPGAGPANDGRVRGVTRQGERWRVRVAVAGRMVYVGSFATRGEAEAAARAAREG